MGIDKQLDHPRNRLDGFWTTTDVTGERQSKNLNYASQVSSLLRKDNLTRPVDNQH